ncbi:MAG: beta-galactosidase [Clostridia bacterium]|nr:beta-galactosidase [Clostridia bacterium]
MRKETVLTHNWYFTKLPQKEIPDYADKHWKKVTLPHTWNAEDGQDGGADYYRGVCYYLRELNTFDLKEGKEYILYFGAASYDATVYIGKIEVARHKGGYSAFSVNITSYLKKGKNTLVVKVSNAPCDDIYPGLADFTFYGGLHRPVTLIELPDTHFDLGTRCHPGLHVFSDVTEDGAATLHLKSQVRHPDTADTVRYTVSDACGHTLVELYTSAARSECTYRLTSPHLWQGVEDPYLYTVTAELIRHNEVLDCVSTRHGIRRFSVDPARGFLLNGKPTPLRGVSRHQDLLGVGNALTPEDHMRDAAIIREIGANTVRLAHYQHSPEFYDLCDAYGFIVWAEIPFISKMSDSEAAHENALSQLRELIEQNFNHASICFWGIANEITIGGEKEALPERLRELNQTVKRLDPTRLSTMAQVSMLPIDSEQNQITDLVAYNHYFGWYGGKLTDNEAWLDRFHKRHPTRPLGLSEYGCEGIVTYHGDTPTMGDYSEAYQALYHEHMLRIIGERPWLWGTYVWNMFDFGCDARNEGGVTGRNNKGLVSFDRKIRKDAFYLYKAYWNPEPMIHICGKRYAIRPEGTATIRVYSNLPTLILSVNGIEIDKKDGDHVFVFDKIPVVEGVQTVSVHAGDVRDTAVFTFQREIPAHYRLTEDAAHGVTNWFEDKTVPQTPLTFREGYYSIRHTLGDLLKSKAAADVITNAFATVSGMRLKPSMLMMLADETPETVLKNPEAAEKLGMTEEQILSLVHTELQKIKIETKSSEASD